MSRLLYLAVVGCHVVAVLVLVPEGAAQTVAASEKPRVVQLNGSVGFLAEAYAVSGIGNRRAPGRFQLNAATSATAYGITYGLDLLLSSDESRVRQSLTRIGLDLRYRWIRVAGGTVTPSLSPYSLSGVTLRGGLLELTPGPLLLTVTGGQSQRATTGTLAFAPAFRRRVYAARIGVGREQRTHVHLTGLLARDDTTGLGVGGGLPQENVSLSPDIGLNLFRNRLSIRVQGTASAITRDVRTEAVDLEGWPSDVFQIHAGTRVDYAAQADVRLNLQRVTLESNYERIQPGFASLGQPNLRSDQERVGVGAQVRLPRVRLGLRLGQSRNNLLNQRMATLQRRRLQAQSQVQVSSALSVAATYSLLLNTSEGGAADLATREQQAHLLTLTPTAVVRQGLLTHTVSLATTLQTLRDRLSGGTAARSQFDNWTAALTYGLALPSGLSFNAGGTYLSSSAPTVEVTAQSINGGGSYVFARTLTLTLNGAWSANRTALRLDDLAQTNTSQQLSLDAGAAYRLPFGDTVRLTVRGLSNTGDADRSFREATATLRFDHRF